MTGHFWNCIPSFEPQISSENSIWLEWLYLECLNVSSTRGQVDGSYKSTIHNGKTIGFVPSGKKFHKTTLHFINDLFGAMALEEQLSPLFFNGKLKFRFGCSKNADRPGEKKIQFHQDGETSYLYRVIVMLLKGEHATKGVKVKIDKNTSVAPGKELDTPFFKALHDRGILSAYCLNSEAGGQSGTGNRLWHAVCGEGKGLTLILDVSTNHEKMDDEIPGLLSNIVQFLTIYLRK